MLDLWVLNVGHGDSIVVRYQGGGCSIVGVIDSNRQNSEEPKFLQILKGIAARDLEFVVVTHPHADHYSGLYRAFEEYPDRIARFFSFPVRGTRDDQLKKLQKMYLRCMEGSDSDTVRAKAADFIRLTAAADRARKAGKLEWRELSGPNDVLVDRPDLALKVSVLLPFRYVKGGYFQAIQNGDVSFIERQDVNSLSVALKIEVHQTEIVLAADAEGVSWVEHKRAASRSFAAPAASVVKLPHHGSQHDCSGDVIDYLFEPDKAGRSRYALISANGRSHPSPNVLQSLRERGIRPYCTNLSRMCGPHTRELFSAPGVAAETAKLINSMDPEPLHGRSQACQGDIHVRVDSAGVVAVNGSTGNVCALRGEI